MRAVLSTAVLGLALAACATTNHDPAVTVLNPALGSSMAGYAAAMAAPRAPMSYASGATVASCREYLAVPDRRDIAPLPDNSVASLDYVTCDSLAVLRDALPVAYGALPGDIGEALANRLDLRSFRSSRHQQTTDQAYTLQAIASAPLKIRRHTAELDTPDWYFKLEVVAVADIDHSGQPDWLIWVVDQSRKGTYLAVQPLLVRDPGMDAELVATPLPR